MTHEPTQLAIKIGKYIQTSRGCSFTEIKTRATKHSIPPDVLEEALRVLHRVPNVHRTVAGGDVQYVWKEVVKKPVTPVSHVEWLKGSNDQGVPNYPPMTSENDGRGFDIDLSWMFLRTLEERQAYKAAVRGVAYIKPQRHEFA